MQPLAFTADGDISGPVTFAGYGIVAPGSGAEPAYDSYGELDVSNRVVLVLHGVPRDLDPARGQMLQRYAGLRYKAIAARERGAIGLLVATDLAEGAPLSLRLDQAVARLRNPRRRHRRRSGAGAVGIRP